MLGVGLLKVEDDGAPADRGEVLGVVGIADEPGDRMPFGGQDLGEAQRDLSVPSGDDDMHTAQPNPARGAAGRSAPHRSRTRHRTDRRGPLGLGDGSLVRETGSATHREPLKFAG